jgi:hypothetical protein
MNIFLTGLSPVAGQEFALGLMAQTPGNIASEDS